MYSGGDRCPRCHRIARELAHTDTRLLLTLYGALRNGVSRRCQGGVSQALGRNLGHMRRVAEEDKTTIVLATISSHVASRRRRSGELRELDVPRWGNHGDKRASPHQTLDVNNRGSRQTPDIHRAFAVSRDQEIAEVDRISEQGSVHGRHALVDAAWSAVRRPGR